MPIYDGTAATNEGTGSVEGTVGGSKGRKRSKKGYECELACGVMP